MKIHTNPNTEELKEIVEAVEANEGYCPCETDKNKDTLCPCKNFRENPTVDFCHCGRYYKTHDYEALALLGDVSDNKLQAMFIDWQEMLIHQQFMVLGIPLNLYNIFYNSEKHINLYKSIIAKADAVVVLNYNQELLPLIEELTSWAVSIGKKVLTREELSK